MQYRCNYCERVFHFEDEINFCPYCGNVVDEDSVHTNSSNIFQDLAQTVDSIWGDNARIRKEFSDSLSKCMFLINDFAEISLVRALPEQDISEFEKNYTIIKQSNNRNTLIARIDKFLDSLRIVIENTNDNISVNSRDAIESVSAEVETMVEELYDFLGMSWEGRKEFIDDTSCSTEVLYTKDQLMELYNVVLVAYSKYKNCVADNNMFAAFASTSDYGLMTNYWRRWSSSISDNKEDTEEKKLPQIDEVIEFMNKQDAIKYFGLLDEDFVPHVDAFWYGIEMLCEFLDDRVVDDFNMENIQINVDTQNKLLRTIASTNFEVTELRLEALNNLKHRFEKQIYAVAD